MLRMEMKFLEEIESVIAVVIINANNENIQQFIFFFLASSR